MEVNRDVFARERKLERILENIQIRIKELDLNVNSSSIRELIPELMKQTGEVTLQVNQIWGPDPRDPHYNSETLRKIKELKLNCCYDEAVKMASIAVQVILTIDTEIELNEGFKSKNN